MQTALAWLLRRAANILFIPGHLAAAELQLPGNAMSRLNAMQSKG